MINGKYSVEERKIVRRIHDLKCLINSSTNPLSRNMYKDELGRLLHDIGHKYKGSNLVRRYRYRRTIKNEGCFFLYLGLMIYRLHMLAVTNKRLKHEIDMAIVQYHKDIDEGIIKGDKD